MLLPFHYGNIAENKTSEALKTKTQQEQSSTQEARAGRLDRGRNSIFQSRVARVFSLCQHPWLIFLVMACLFVLTDAILPLQGLWFHTAMLTQLSQWILLPSHLVFPGWTLSPTLFNAGDAAPPLTMSWQETPILLVLFLLLLSGYLLAVRTLPSRVTRRYIILSTLLLGLIYVLAPVVTSQDIFSYIIYARMEVIYHLNALTTIPQQIQHDPVYQHLYWKDQPSAYGPIWIFITYPLQWLTNLFSSGMTNIALMVLALRLLSLAAHIWSVLLVWSIAGHLQRMNGNTSPRMRLQATLAFAWNPLLLFEACINAHNDSIVLLFVLIAILLLVRKTVLTPFTYLSATIMLALATSLKINIVLLLPGLLFLLWTRRRRLPAIAAVLAIYAGIIVILYAPFWQQGHLLAILHINPATYRNINTLPDFLTHFSNSLLRLLGLPIQPDIGSPAENIFHTLSFILFAAGYGWLCWRALRHSRHSIHTPLHLMRWMTLVWFLYCLVGAPWFWPWYSVTFFGLFALVSATDLEQWQKSSLPGGLRLPLAAHILAFSMLCLYCFTTFALYETTIPWLPGFRWSFLRGLVWCLPLLAILFHQHKTAENPPIELYH
ncbi:MAG TPA: hypothetical protein VFB12_12330 [Ktedonobacteraceae bacterium]|nr:hypothetical protein [Ktedonobacteraceae bacterium]